MTAPNPSADLEALLAHAGWIRRLARGLVVDTNQAEDVVQQSWVAALDHPPRHASNLRAWWSQVVRNTARQLGRTESRRVEREKVAPRPEPLASPEDLAQQAELHQMLVGAVLALEEPYRSAVLLRYYHDQSPQQIAEIHGVPGSTARSWLRRGIEQLRAQLDERVEGGRSAWTLILAPFGSSKSTPVPLAPVSAISAPTVGVLAMALQTKLVLGAALVGAIAATWVLSRPVAIDREAQTTAGPAVEKVSDASQGAVAAVVPAESSERREALLEATVAGSTQLAYIGMVRDPAGDPIEGALLSVLVNDAPQQDQAPVAEGTSDADGRFRIKASASAGRRALRARAKGYVTRTVSSIEPDRECELELAWATDVSGTVTDAVSGDPVADANVTIQGQKVRTGADGNFRIESLTVGQMLGVETTAEGFAAQEQTIVLPRQDETRFDIALQRGFPLVIEVFDATTKLPIAGATVQSSLYGPRRPSAQTDETGRVELRVVERASLALRLDAEGYCSFLWIWESVEELDRAHRIPMLGVAWVEGTIRFDGVACPVSVRDENEGSSSDRRNLTSEELRTNDLSGQAWYETVGIGHRAVKEDGYFNLGVIPCSKPYSVVATASGYALARSDPVLLDTPGARASVSIDMTSGAAVSGRVLINGQPWLQGRVFASDASGGPIDQTWTGVNGEYQFPRLPAGELHLAARTSSGSILGTEIVFIAEPGETYERDIVLEVQLATISGHVMNQDGTPAPGQLLSAFRDGPNDEYHTKTRTKDDGSYVIQVPPSRDYDLMLLNGKFIQRRSAVAAGSKDIDFELPTLGQLRIQLIDASSKEPIHSIEASQWKLAWRRSGEEAFQDKRGAPDVEGMLELELPVGRLDLRIALVKEGYMPRTLFGLEVEEHSSNPMLVELEHGVAATLDFESDPPIGREQTSGHLIFLLEESELTSLRGPFPSQGGPSNIRINGVNMWLGDPSLMQRLLDPGGNDNIRVPGLAPGRYWIRAFPDDFLFEPQSFLVNREDVDLAIHWRAR